MPSDNQITHNTIRCSWAEDHDLMRDYHDHEWGVPVHDDRLLFELLVMEGAQAGLSWLTVLKKRDAYREAYRGFHPEDIAGWTERDIERCIADPGIIRNRRKIESSVKNARKFIEVAEEAGSFDAYIWRFVDGSPIQNAWRSLKDIPTTTGISDRMSKDLKKRGFSFVGTTICYAYMQSIGMVNDHLTDCFRYRELNGSHR